MWRRVVCHKGADQQITWRSSSWYSRPWAPRMSQMYCSWFSSVFSAAVWNERSSLLVPRIVFGCTILVHNVRTDKFKRNGPSGTGMGFCPSTLVIRWQYHSTIDPYSFIHFFFLSSFFNHMHCSTTQRYIVYRRYIS
jgi:hypothetical protein